MDFGSTTEHQLEDARNFTGADINPKMIMTDASLHLSKLTSGTRKIPDVSTHWETTEHPKNLIPTNGFRHKLSSPIIRSPGHFRVV